MPKPLAESTIALVRHLTEVEGLSAREVAARVGKTRASVIGIWWRHGMKPARQPHQRGISKRPQAPLRQAPSLPPVLARLPLYKD